MSLGNISCVQGFWLFIELIYSTNEYKLLINLNFQNIGKTRQMKVREQITNINFIILNRLSQNMFQQNEK